MRYPQLFAPLKLRNTTLPNRLVMPPMSTQLASPEGLVTAQQIAFYRARAKGGTGLVIVEFCCIDRASGQSEPHQLALETQAHIQGHRKLVRAIRAAGAVTCLQLQHGGGSARRDLICIDTPLGPSDVFARKKPHQQQTRAMTHAEIEQLIECFGRSAELGVKAGYQVVELHGAHGYLITQFLSPHYNRRDDAWGGNESTRMEFPRRVIARVRKAIGNRPLILRISADEFVSDGLSIEDMERITPQLVDVGLDALHVSLGIGPDSFDKVLEPMSAPEGWRLPYARRIRQANTVPVIAVGQIRHPDTAQQALVNGDADLIALGRPLLADPEWANKARRGQADDIIPCTSCNYCVTNGFAGKSIACANNPRCGRELQPLPKKQTQRRTAIVIGAGPGGMNAALLLERAGFHTQLIEASNTLGGGLIASAAPPHKQLLERYQRYLQKRISHSNVSVSLNCKATSQSIIEQTPHCVIVATGMPHTKSLEGVTVAKSSPPLIDAYRLLSGACEDLPLPDAGTIAVYGGGETGCETAEWLAQRGFEVLLVSRSDKRQLARAAEIIYRADLLKRLFEHPKIDVQVNSTLVQLEDAAMILRAKGDHGEAACIRSHKVCAVVIAQGRYADDDLPLAVRNAGINIRLIGDARNSGRIGDAVHDAYDAVLSVCQT